MEPQHLLENAVLGQYFPWWRKLSPISSGNVTHQTIIHFAMGDVASAAKISFPEASITGLHYINFPIFSPLGENSTACILSQLFVGTFEAQQNLLEVGIGSWGFLHYVHIACLLCRIIVYSKMLLGVKRGGRSRFSFSVSVSFLFEYEHDLYT